MILFPHIFVRDKYKTWDFRRWNSNFCTSTQNPNDWNGKHKSCAQLKEIKDEASKYMFEHWTN